MIGNLNEDVWFIYKINCPKRKDKHLSLFLCKHSLYNALRQAFLLTKFH
ncbi:unnamed protein product [Larinioides sclopetarius]|uniref:Uncharacterized protein n=1 Tax=Larinioides sclopetarius TaxID=280406 RepID=A0AAV2A1M8_9ARAC